MRETVAALTPAIRATSLKVCFLVFRSSPRRSILPKGSPRAAITKVPSRVQLQETNIWMAAGPDVAGGVSERPQVEILLERSCVAQVQSCTDPSSVCAVAVKESTLHMKSYLPRHGRPM